MPPVNAASDPERRQRPGVIVGERLALQLGDEPLVVPHFEVVVLTEDVHLAGHAGAVAQARLDDHTTLRVELGDLSEVVDPVEKPPRAGWLDGTAASLASMVSQTGRG